MGRCMADCDVCGASGVNTRNLPMHGALLDVCAKCQNRMGLTADEPRGADLGREQSPRSGRGRRGHAKASRSRPGTDLMASSGVELADDFAARIRQAREQKGWDQRTLAQKMNERINEVKRAESGQRPSDKVLTKFERSLDIVLMETVDGGHESHVKRSTPRTLNLGDILDAAKRESD